MTFEIDGLTKAARQPDEQMTVYELADGSLFPVAGPPRLADASYAAETHEAARIVREALGQLASVEARRREAKADPTLSPVGRAQRVEEMRRLARVGLEMARAELAKARDGAVRLKEAVFAPPRLGESDLAAALIDQEIRAHVRSLRGQDLVRYTSGLADNPRHLAAIMRSPVPITGVSEYAQGLWRDTAAGHPQAAGLIRTEAAIAWAEGVLPHIAERI
ncbi:hypothetical protein QO010_000379 [Caulobacter ginsengisoli]|uniref:Uncharacterized protein n=1 Tax=Caulobacter ginsengisoli TaxID=400775 RepID=A0ABU0IML9_9CAUL|nr:hypothetical protein [Caulobacter ginsengisoli]MDQ0462631.1 hypothetical protein [Caulobacter ginsengisoli]